MIVKVREANTREPVSHPFWKNTLPVSLVAAAAPGDMNEGYQPSNCCPVPRRSTESKP